MQTLKSQIKESFFNPLLHFLPLLVFIVVDDFWGMSIAWRVSFPVAIGMLFYIRRYYQRLFVWNAAISTSYLLISLGVSITPLLSSNLYLFRYIDEIFFILLMLFLLTDKKYLKKLSKKTLPNTLPLSNNFYEFNRIIKHLLLIVLLYLFMSTLIELRIIDYHYIKPFKIGYMLSITIVLSHEMIRVSLVRKKLFNEKWLPIVNKQGEVIGSFQQQTLRQANNRHLHPVARCYFINNGLILLRQKEHTHPFEPMLWDTAISEHLRVGESIENTIRNSAKKRYNTLPNKVLHITKYIHQSEIDYQFIYLSISCLKEVCSDTPNSTHTKWWTVKQIEENLHKAIFTERFEKEYEILKRYGITESNHCECYCKLKEVILNDTEKSNK